MIHRVLLRHGHDDDGLPLFSRIPPTRKRALPKDPTRYRVVQASGEFCSVVNDERLCFTKDPEHEHVR